MINIVLTQINFHAKWQTLIFIMNILNLLKTNQHRNNEMLLRDITGECEGECRDRVREGEIERQNKIRQSGFAEPESFPNAKGAHLRNEPPGFLGGHV